MARSPSSDTKDRLERITALAGDLSRELIRTHSESPTTATMADQIRSDAEAELRALKKRQRAIPAKMRAGR